jgi:hypothetical protein
MGEDVDLEWHGVMRRETYSDWVVKVRDRLADAARDGRWSDVFATLDKHPSYVNAWRVGGTSRYTPLHQAAYLGAPAKVIERLLCLGAWRTLRNARGERAVDTGARRGHDASVSLLEPAAVSMVPSDALNALEASFHQVIRARVGELVDEHQLRLPEIALLTELPLQERVWFSVPGMYGGFAFWLERAGADPLLLAESWCRVVDGSGKRHAIDSSGWRLTDAGFV